MLNALDLILGDNGGQEVPYSAHPGMFRSPALAIAVVAGGGGLVIGEASQALV
jgi:hypothetical protein